MTLMMEALNFAPFKTFTELYAPAMNFEVSYDIYHELKLSIHDVLENNRHITSDNFPDVEDPELVDENPETPVLVIHGNVKLILNTRAPLKL